MGEVHSDDWSRTQIVLDPDLEEAWQRFMDDLRYKVFVPISGRLSRRMALRYLLHREGYL